MAEGVRRGKLLAAFAAVGAALVLSACTIGGEDTLQAKGEAPAAVSADDVSEVRISGLPKNGAINVDIDKATKIAVRGGRLTHVTLTDAAGERVKGTMAAAGGSWHPDGQLERSTSYTISATAEDANGHTAYATSSFTTAP
ncbi:Ig-like domain-containing protein [Actinomycetota bacterium Odt1-20B]